MHTIIDSNYESYGYRIVIQHDVTSAVEESRMNSLLTYGEETESAFDAFQAELVTNAKKIRKPLYVSVNWEKFKGDEDIVYRIYVEIRSNKDEMFNDYPDYYSFKIASLVLEYLKLDPKPDSPYDGFYKMVERGAWGLIMERSRKDDIPEEVHDRIYDIAEKEELDQEEVLEYIKSVKGKVPEDAYKSFLQGANDLEVSSYDYYK